ncbi:hypothetical protein AUG19_05275 [archaeon 13_1_20CM_2_54_9]|nr:MAG: hypothetical protein AUG19_05275 [archaeon 13_1_20CM_2_54_9]
MFDHKHYVPILRWKQGEQLALRELYPTDKSSMTPLIEIPYDYDKTLGETVAAIAKNWGASAIFFDVVPLAPRLESLWGKYPVANVFAKARDAGLRLIPVTSLGCNPEFLAAVRGATVKDQPGACVRLFREDLAKTTLGVELNSHISLLGLQPSSVDLLLDLKVYDHADDRYVRFCSSVPNLPAWRTFTIASGAFRQDLTGLSVGQHKLHRDDWQSWRNQITSTLLRQPTYGDYATLHPFLISDIKGLNPSASIRYTCEDYWVVMRGEGLRNKSGTGHAQYPANAKLLTLRSEYCGQHFSFGDNYIYDISLNKGKTGNPRTWVTAGVNHHLTFAVRQIGSSFKNTEKE